MDEPPTIAAVVPETIAAASPIAPGKKVALAATATVVTEASASAVVVDVVAAGSRLPAERDLPSLPSEREFSRLSSRDKLQTAILDVHRAVTVTQEIVKIAETARPMLKYLMLRSLGTGTHSTVHLIQRKRDARLLVMKRWTKTGPSALREAKLLQALHHPNIVRVHEHFVDPATAQLCIVMDYASGGDLQRRIDTAREAGEVIADEYALRVLVQLCLATAHIHARGIMHRDIKPANIFIAETPNRDSGGGGEVLCYLGDFSVSTQLAAGGGGGAGSLNLAQTITGTPYYLAPEIVRGEPYGVKSDMWAVGVVLYLMLTLELPFAASSLPALARLITDAEAQMPRERDAQLLQAVRMCLAKDAEARPAASAMLRLPAMQMMRKRYTSRKLRQATVSNLNLSPAVHVSPALNKQLSERESRPAC